MITLPATSSIPPTYVGQNEISTPASPLPGAITKIINIGDTITSGEHDVLQAGFTYTGAFPPSSADLATLVDCLAKMTTDQQQLAIDEISEKIINKIDDRELFNKVLTAFSNKDRQDRLPGELITALQTKMVGAISNLDIDDRMRAFSYISKQKDCSIAVLTELAKTLDDNQYSFIWPCVTALHEHIKNRKADEANMSQLIEHVKDYLDKTSDLNPLKYKMQSELQSIHK
jgi:uncharacterized membrane-anchored protein YjiN (DUF445 family)